jgi:hypothetical protein
MVLDYRAPESIYVTGEAVNYFGEKPTLSTHKLFSNPQLKSS